MATVGRANHASYMNTSRLSYYSTANYYNNFFAYTTSVNAQGTTVGTFTPVSGATLANCPAGRVLRETGRKLYPGANPSVNTYMVSVYDAQTQLTGFIDPNASMFTIYNTDKPNFISDGVDAASGVGTDAAMSIYTLGNITAGGFVSTASYITSASSITAAKSVTAGTYYSSGVIAPAIYYTGYTQLNYANAAGSNNADVFANPALANVANITIMSTMTNLTGSVNLYLRDPTNPSNPLSTPVLAVGEPFTVVVNNQTNGTPHIQFSGNEIRAQQPTQYYMSTLSRTVYSFVSLNNSGPSNGGGPVFLATNGGVANQNTYPA